MPNFDTTAAAVVIPAEKIESYIDGYGYAALTGLAICASVQAQGAIAIRMPRFGSITVPSGTKTEGDDFDEAVPSMAEESLTPGFVGFEIPITDETVLGKPGISEAVLLEAMAAMQNRIDRDIHAASTSATNTQGSSTDIWNREKVTAAAAAYRALNIPGQTWEHALAVGGAGHTQLEQDELLSAASRSVGMFAPVSAVSGYLGMYGAFNLFATQNLATEGGANSNYMTPIGNGRSGIAIGVSVALGVESNRGREGALSQRTFHVVRCMYGAAMRNRTRLLQVLSSTA